jgi:hypothetical protein
MADNSNHFLIFLILSNIHSSLGNDQTTHYNTPLHGSTRDTCTTSFTSQVNTQTCKAAPAAISASGSAPGGDVFCSEVLRCIFHLFDSKTQAEQLLIEHPINPNFCSHTCNQQQGLVLLAQRSYGERWRIGNQHYPCNTRRMNSLICQ